MGEKSMGENLVKSMDETLQKICMGVKDGEKSMGENLVKSMCENLVKSMGENFAKRMGVKR